MDGFNKRIVVVVLDFSGFVCAFHGATLFRDTVKCIIIFCWNLVFSNILRNRDVPCGCCHRMHSRWVAPSTGCGTIDCAASALWCPAGRRVMCTIFVNGVKCTTNDGNRIWLDLRSKRERWWRHSPRTSVLRHSSRPHKADVPERPDTWTKRAASDRYPESRIGHGRFVL